MRFGNQSLSPYPISGKHWLRAAQASPFFLPLVSACIDPTGCSALASSPPARSESLFSFLPTLGTSSKYPEDPGPHSSDIHTPAKHLEATFSTQEITQLQERHELSKYTPTKLWRMPGEKKHRSQRKVRRRRKGRRGTEMVPLIREKF